MDLLVHAPAVQPQSNLGGSGSGFEEKRASKLKDKRRVEIDEESNMPCLSCESCASGGGRCRCGGEGDEFGGCKRRNLKNRAGGLQRSAKI